MGRWWGSKGGGEGGSGGNKEGGEGGRVDSGSGARQNKACNDVTHYSSEWPAC